MLQFPNPTALDTQQSTEERSQVLAFQLGQPLHALGSHTHTRPVSFSHANTSLLPEVLTLTDSPSSSGLASGWKS